MKEAVINALAEYIAPEVSRVADMGMEESIEVSKKLFLDDEEFDLPSPAAVLVDLMDERMIAKYSTSENEFVKKFIAAYSAKLKQQEPTKDEVEVEGGTE